MKLTIIPVDGAVYKDGVSYSDLDLSSVPSDVHALQFNSASNTGWVEFTNTIPNENITELPVWANDCLAKWEEAKAKAEAEAEAVRLAAEQATQQTE